MCAAITYHSIKKHLFDDHIYFSFLIKRNGKDSLKAGKSSESVKNELAKGKKKPSVQSRSGKSDGVMKSNNVRTSSSVPSSSAGADTTPAKKEQAKPELKNPPPEYSSINKANSKKDFTSPAFSSEALTRNDDELVGSNRSFI